MLKKFIVTVDTEGDNLWEKTVPVRTLNLRYTPRFQKLCEKYGFTPTYFVNHEAALDDEFVVESKDWLARGVAEIGLHIHGWNSPPYYERKRLNQQTFLIQEPTERIREKVRLHLELLNDRFGQEIKSHRAGRWVINAEYLQILKSYGVKTDCSITPHVNWGDIDLQYRECGVDYSDFKNLIYKLENSNLVQINELCKEDFLEFPTSIIKEKSILYNLSILGRVYNRVYPQYGWVRPSGTNLGQMKKVVSKLERINAPYVMFIIHSSELMPGGSPYFTNKKAIDRLYNQLELFFSYMKKRGYAGYTVNKFRNELIHGK